MDGWIVDEPFAFNPRMRFRCNDKYCEHFFHEFHWKHLIFARIDTIRRIWSIVKLEEGNEASGSIHPPGVDRGNGRYPIDHS